MSREITNNEAKLVLNIPRDLHATIKSIAAFKHISVKDLILNEILSKFKKELCEFGYEHKLNAKTKARLEHSAKHPEEMKAFKDTEDMMSYLTNLAKNEK